VVGCASGLGFRGGVRGEGWHWPGETGGERWRVLGGSSEKGASWTR
jgi:hypothetical protein